MSEQRVIRVEGMSCGHCEAAVRSATEKLPGVTRVEASAGADRAVVHYEAGAEPTWDAVRRAIEDAGFDVGDDD